MQVRVNVPVHIIIDPDTATSHRDHIDAALTEAARRALLNARGVIGQTSHEMTVRQVHDPVVSWSGPGLTAMTDHDRRRVEELVHTVLTTVRADTLPGTNTGPGDHAGRSAAPRNSRLGTSETSVSLPGLTFTAQPTTQVWKTGLDRAGEKELFDQARIEEYFTGAVPPQVGVVAMRGDGGLRLHVWRHPSDELLFAGIGRSLRTYDKVMNGNRLTVVSTPCSPPASATYRLRYLGPARTEADLRKAYTDLLGPETDPARSKELALEITAWVDRALREKPTCLLMLEVDGKPFLLECAGDCPDDLDAELVPIVSDVPVTGEDRKGKGGEGTVAPSSPGGPLGETTEGGHIWPAVGIVGELLVCEPFLLEPAATALADDHGLFARMRLLAAELEVPECGYLGMFALNCAKVVGSRAWSIGVSSVGAATTTQVTVREDGSGNNGFVDLAPGASPDFEYLRVLGRITSDLHAFGRDVSTAYLDPRNAALVRPYPEAGPDAGAWGLHFEGTFHEQLVSGYTYLYAEMCRMLLLQQLRSSRAGIEGRLGRFDQTLKSFNDTLDILGETVVELSVLRTAIRHSRTVHTTGPVRQVLSVPEELTDPDGVTITLGRPIESVPQRILALVGDAPVARRGALTVVTFRGRDWTVEDLDAEIGLRRGLVNLVDPLFLQVADLDRLFDDAQRDPGSVRRHLQELLQEMLRANVGMTDKAARAFGGAFFALEASQYIRREGVRGWQGLRFELQGIHLLADQQLRPMTGGDPLYDEGINAALGRKADFDAFLSGFSIVGVVALGALCAPLGALVAGLVMTTANVGLAVLDRREAEHRRDLYRALLQPELFESWQEVQLAELMAQLSTAFAVFDAGSLVAGGAKAIVGTARQSLRIARRAGPVVAAQALARTFRQQVVRTMTEQVLANAVRQALTNVAVGEVMNLLLPEVIMPVLVPWLRDQAREHGTLAEVDAALGALVAEGGRP